MWQLAEAVRGIGDACRALDVPITGGNVSLYNETEGEAIYPTPVIGMVGLLDHATQTVTRQFKSDGAAVVVLGDNRGELGGSEYLALLHERVAGEPPLLDLARERALQRLVLQVIREGVIESAHDCAEGGVAITLAECCFDAALGVRAEFTSVNDVPAPFAVNATLFGESASRIVVSARPEKLERLLAIAGEHGVVAHVVGTAGGDRIELGVDGKKVIDLPLAQAEEAWETSIERRMTRRS
jgi:phosphoribosylformylglycinamidine (FGAM) synthase-like enzyme